MPVLMNPAGDLVKYIHYGTLWYVCIVVSGPQGHPALTIPSIGSFFISL